MGGLLKAKEVCARAFILPLRDFQRTSYLVSDMLLHSQCHPATNPMYERAASRPNGANKRR